MINKKQQDELMNAVNHLDMVYDYSKTHNDVEFKAAFHVEKDEAIQNSINYVRHMIADLR